MIKRIIPFTLLMCVLHVHAQDEQTKEVKETALLQQANFSVGKTFTSFVFTNTDGNTLENIGYVSGNAYAFSLGLGIGDRQLIRPEILYSEAGAKSEYLDVPINWKLTYIGAGASYLIKVLNKENISLSPGLIVGYDYLMKGEQIIGTERFNLTENDNLKTWDLNGGVLVNSRFKVTESLYLNFEYRFNLGLNQIEKKDDGERTRNLSHKALIGLSFNL